MSRYLGDSHCKGNCAAYGKKIMPLIALLIICPVVRIYYSILLYTTNILCHIFLTASKICGIIYFSLEKNTA
jgi:hypothetical protein